MTNRYTVKAAEAAVQHSDDGLYGVLLARGTLELGYYVPRDTDGQQPHEQDEVYVVRAGSGTFVLDGRAQAFGPGDALFVAAGKAHHFANFSDDFAAWVVFYGPAGGEAQ